MKYILAILLALALVSYCKADGDVDALVASILKEREAKQKPRKPDGEPGVVPFLTDYMKAGEKAVKEGKPLFVWVAYKCPSSANQMPEAVHVFLDTFQGDKTQRVIAGVPDGHGWLNNAGTVHAADCCASALNKMVRGVDTPTPQGKQLHMGSGMQPVQPGIMQPGIMQRSAPTRNRGGGACAT